MRDARRHVVALALALPVALGSAPAAAQRRPARAAREAPASWWKLATFRTMLGATQRSDGASDATFDLHAGLRAFDTHPTRGYWIFGADVGLSMRPFREGAPVLWQAGPGVSYGTVWLTVGWSPRLVVGTRNGVTETGLRNTLSACTFLGAACVDVSHQWLDEGASGVHELRLAFGFDLGMLAQAIVQFAGARPG